MFCNCFLASAIRAMFGNNNSGENLSLGPIADLAKTKNDIELQQQLNDVSLKLKRLSSNKTFETNSISSDTSDQVSQNPYQSWTNLPKLQQTYDNDYNKFMKLAKDQRSQEVSDNVIREMDENNLDTAVLVLGAQHKDQITSYLNSKNVNVIVITPSSELNYQG